MDVLLSAVASVLIGRLVSFLVGKYQEPSPTDGAVRLQRLLLRARVVVEEAEGRQITNRAMLQQLNQLRLELCRTAYALDVDAFRWRTTNPSRSTTSPSYKRPAPSSYCSAFISSAMVESLEIALRDMREFIVLLNGCPRVTRQPYNTYLFMENCMFGQQMEKEEIVSFLSRPSQDLDVLPIIGPHGVGKRTLVEHACLDEKVHERFDKIHHLSSNELNLYNYGHHWSLFDFTARLLMVIDIVGNEADVEKSCRRFCSAVRRRGLKGSKIIVVSRTEPCSSLGTVPPLVLHAPRREELWYFFKALAFGAADPNERPDLVRIAIAIFQRFVQRFNDFGLFADASIISTSLRADLSTHSWRRMLKVFSEAAVLQLDAPGYGLDEEKDGHYFLCRPVKDAPGAQCLFYNRRKLIGMDPSELPKVTMLDLLNGSSLPPTEETRFDVLAWQARIPPYASYVATCDTNKAYHHQVIALKTRLLSKRRDHQEDDPNN